MQSAKLIVAAVSMAVAGALSQPAAADSRQAAQIHNHSPVVLAAVATEQSEFNATKAALRHLWIGHVFWVRNVVVAELAGDAAARKAAETEVVANAKSIAASIATFYGDPAGRELFTLLANHYGAVKAYLDGSIAEHSAKQAAATAKLLGNAAEIASFLSSANPYLPKDAVEGLLQAHGSHHVAQIQQLRANDYASEAQTWADMSQHMYVISDAIADALAKQFPAKV